MDSQCIYGLGIVLKNEKFPLKKRFRALFTLKNLADTLSVQCITNCFDDKSALLKHELAYCLGQMRNVSAIPALIAVLEDETQEVVVRHEAGKKEMFYFPLLFCIFFQCDVDMASGSVDWNFFLISAEALGAIGDASAIHVLEKYKQCEIKELSETCELSLGRLKYFADGNDDYTNVYGSVDPAPPSEEVNIELLKRVYLNENENIFERYRAMFALRNLNTEESILTIVKGNLSLVDYTYYMYLLLSINLEK